MTLGWRGRTWSSSVVVDSRDGRREDRGDEARVHIGRFSESGLFTKEHSQDAIDGPFPGEAQSLTRLEPIGTEFWHIEQGCMTLVPRPCP